MKKIPCLFQRDFVPRARGRGSDAILRPDLTVGLDRVLAEGRPTVKHDGTACAVIVVDGSMGWAPIRLRSSYHLFRRYDAKMGKVPPEGAIPCDDPDPVTGHWPHWIPVGDEPESKWMREAYLRLDGPLRPGTYEFIGPHIQGNPQKRTEDVFEQHGQTLLHFDSPTVRSFEGLREFLTETPIEGIVFWLDGEPRAKIRRKDYGLSWPIPSPSQKEK